ncbi:MAG TPA: DinB family protein [Vicinamibacterales bacterium]|nr:DinB family protein [Vicinamibacterales bacterium]
MSMTLAFDELLQYTSDEREKWRAWLRAHPSAMEVAVQPAGSRLPSVGKLIDHIFLVEQRHLQRLREEPLSNSTGLTANNAPPLFDYGASVRRELERFVEALDEDLADQLRTFNVQDRDWLMTPRKLLFHILFHEIRHWAQVALAVRSAGFDPPGDHDLFYSGALR